MSTDSTEKLQIAIQKLEAFSRQIHEKCSETPLQQTISLIRTKIVDIFPEKIAAVLDFQPTGDHPEGILQVVEIIHRERLLIQKLKSGSPSERSLADSFAKSIEAYNKTRELYLKQNKLPQKSLSLSLFKKIVRSPFDALPKIDLPQSSTIKYHFPAAPKTECSKKKTSPLGFTSSLSSPLTQQSKELFQMKALALLERYGIASNPEARAFVKHSPISTTFVPGSPKCTLSQTLSLFPGQTIVVMGNTELDPTTQTINKLFPETFSISLESSQTGFPHPSQRVGWSLANELLPHCPQRLDMLPCLSAFYLAKQQAATDLLPEGKHLIKAKKLLKLKRSIFNSNKTVFIGLHKQLAQAIVQAAQDTDNSQKAIIESFFDELESQTSPFDALAATSDLLQDKFISGPYRHLLHTILNEENRGPVRISYDLAQRTFEKAVDEAKIEAREYHKTATHLYECRKWAYIELIGSILGNSSQNIILQYLSEDLVFPPPVLSAFARKIQAAAYRQVEDFLLEIYSDTVTEALNEQSMLFEMMKAQIESDILIFKDAYDPSPVDELATYFNQRHQQLK